MLYTRAKCIVTKHSARVEDTVREQADFALARRDLQSSKGEPLSTFKHFMTHRNTHCSQGDSPLRPL